jgi:hypothetical protein
MTAIFQSSSWVTVVLPVPIRSSTTGGSAPIDRALATSASIALSDYRLTIYASDSDGSATTVCNALCDALPSGVFASIDGLQRNFFIRLNPAVFSIAGVCFAQLSYVPDADYAWTQTSFQWGGWVDTMLGLLSSIDGLSTSTAATVDQTVAILSASYDVDDPSAPTVQTLSIGGSPIATRTIANADGSPINPAQVLILGELTAVP